MFALFPQDVSYIAKVFFEMQGNTIELRSRPSPEQRESELPRSGPNA